jgi:NTP pyrophosphatase (non-canonical NTP hydrolase)
VSPEPAEKEIGVARFQRLIADQFLERDRARGLASNFAWLAEEVGEVARAIRSGERRALEEELADVVAWTASLANVAGIDLAGALIAKYGAGCPRCGSTPCRCPSAPPAKGDAAARERGSAPLR